MTQQDCDRDVCVLCVNHSNSIVTTSCCVDSRYLVDVSIWNKCLFCFDVLKYVYFTIFIDRTIKAGDWTCKLLFSDDKLS